MMKTLVIRACAIGDFVLNLPALRAMQDLHPAARFTLVGYPETLSLAQDFVSIEAVASIDSDPWRKLFYASVPGLDFDSAVVWMKEPAVADNLRRSGIENVFRADPFPAHGHAAAHLLRTLGLAAPSLPDLWNPGERIVIHRGSGSPKKCWPHFDELLKRMPGATVLKGPAEGEVRPLPLADVCSLLRGCRAYIGNDSGITHLAAYLGVPALALFGPTDPRIWGPIGRRVRIIWKSRLEEISVGEVLAANYANVVSRK